MKSSELLQAGPNPTEIGAGAGAGGRGPFVPPEHRIPPEKLPENLRAKFPEGMPEMRGGGGDAIDEWAAQRGGYDKLLQQIEQNKWEDNSVWKLPDGTQLSVAEVRRRAAAVASPPPEPRPAPRPADWRDSLPQDQQQRLKEKEQRWSQLQPVQLTAMQEKISVALSNWGLGIDWPDELKKANISPEDGSIILRALGEEISRKQEVKGKEQLQLMIDLLGLRGHFDFLKVKYKLTDDTAVFEYLKEADRKAKILFRNLPYDLFPLKLQEQIISLIRGRRNGGI